MQPVLCKPGRCRFWRARADLLTNSCRSAAQSKSGTAQDRLSRRLPQMCLADGSGTGWGTKGTVSGLPMDGPNPSGVVLLRRFPRLSLPLQPFCMRASRQSCPPSAFSPSASVKDVDVTQPVGSALRVRVSSPANRGGVFVAVAAASGSASSHTTRPPPTTSSSSSSCRRRRLPHSSLSETNIFLPCLTSGIAYTYLHRAPAHNAGPVLGQPLLGGPL